MADGATLSAIFCVRPIFAQCGVCRKKHKTEIFTMSEYRIYDSIKSGKRGHVSFHTPGHKGGGALSALFSVCGDDVTELSYTDELGSPSGPIAEAQSDIAMIAGAKRAFITTDGSTSSILSMFWAIKDRGGKIIVPRGSHKSVWNACRLFKIEPVIVQGEERDGIVQPPDAAEIARLVAGDDDIIGMIATSPDYYGNIAPLEKYAEALHSRGKVLLVDGAHGAHLAFESGRAGYAGVYADAWADGAHKTLPTLTQGAIVHANRDDVVADLREGAGIFRTTSPSYPIMASIEYGAKYLAEHGGALIDALKREFSLMKMRLKKRGVLFYEGGETLQFAVDFGGMGISPYLAEEQLEKRKIYAEMNDGRYILFYFSPLTRPRHLLRLERAIRRLAKMRSLKDTYAPKPATAYGVKKFSYLTALTFRKESVPVEECAGRIAARNAGVTPPCIPVVLAGEQITPQAAEALKKSKHVFGIADGKIEVIKIGGEK